MFPGIPFTKISRRRNSGTEGKAGSGHSLRQSGEPVLRCRPGCNVPEENYRRKVSGGNGLAGRRGVDRRNEEYYVYCIFD